VEERDHDDRCERQRGRSSRERYKTLPISRGRGQFTVGYWYLSHGNEEEAREWFWRSVEAYGGNNAAHYYLGLYAMDEGRYEEAARHFAVCTDVRPDKADYRLALADALVFLQDLEAAAQQLALATQLEPGDARLWACHGVVLSGMGREAEARRALEQALVLAPRDPQYARLEARIALTEAIGEHALYDERFVTFGEDDVYQQSDAAGFIRLTEQSGLPTLS
jgi:Flp pilus assembly protein TadD